MWSVSVPIRLKPTGPQTYEFVWRFGLSDLEVFSSFLCGERDERGNDGGDNEHHHLSFTSYLLVFPPL
jgi:hypothetical protein